MKPLRSTFLACVVALGAAAFTQQISTTVDGTPVVFSDVQPMMVNGRVLVPMRGVFEHMGADIDWNAATQTVTAKTAARTVMLRVGDQFATVDGRTVALDQPALTYRNRTMVPLRFLGEALGAEVAWVESSRLVAIKTGDVVSEPEEDMPPLAVLNAYTVVPLRLNTQLGSNTSAPGDAFTARLENDYQGLPAGTVVEGRVTEARAKTSGAPGVLGIDYERLILPNGKAYAVEASPVGLDEKSVTHEDNGRIVAKDKAASKDTLKWVGIGAGGGALVAILTKGNILTDALIGGALGWLFSEIQRNPAQSRDVALATGTPIGMRLDSKLTVRPNGK